MLTNLPVVALAASSRKFALVCLSAKLVPLRVRFADIRKRRSVESKVAAMVAELDEVAANVAPETLILERDPRQRRLVVPGRSRVVEWAQDRGLRLKFEAAADACARVAGATNTFAAAERLSACYPPLAELVLNESGRLHRDHDRWRELRPLVNAFALAHAFAADAVQHAFGDRGPSTRRTPSTYDPRDSRPE